MDRDQWMAQRGLIRQRDEDEQQPAWLRAEVRTPARPAAMPADVVVPLVQAFITGGLTGVIIAGMLWAFGVADELGRVATVLPIMAAGVVTLGTWIWLLHDHQRHLWHTELHESDNTQPEQPAATPPRVGVRLEVSERNRAAYAHLPIEYAALRQVAKAMASDARSFSVASLTGRGKPLSRAEFEQLRSWLLEQDYAEWVDANNRQLGIQMTNKGQALWRGLASQPPHPTLAQ